MNSQSCIFCKIARKETPARIVFETESLIAFQDIQPQAPVHIVIVPRSHIDTLSHARQEHKELLGELLLAAQSIARDLKVDQGGYRTVINCNKDAGQEVFHLHVHLLAGRRFSWPPG